MNAYSYWEQGRNLASGQIVSMTPFSPSNRGGVLGWWKGLLKTLGGILLLLVPGVGPFAGGAAISYGVVEMFQCLTVKKTDLEDLDDKIPLLQFGIAAALLESANKQVSFLLEQQEFRKPMRFAAPEDGARTVNFLLEPVAASSWFRKDKVFLKPISAPSQLP